VLVGADAPQSGGVADSAAPFLPNINDQYLKPGEVRKIVLQAEDLDGDPVTFRLSGAIPNVVLGNIDTVARKATLFIGPLSSSRGPVQLRIQANDNKQQSYLTLPFQIALSDVPNDDTGSGNSGGTGGGQSNRLPTAVIAPLPATIDAIEVDGLVLQLNATLSTDPDLDSLTYSWRVNGTEVAQGAIADVKFVLGTHVITLIVNDGRGGTGTATTTIEVLPRPLSITAISPTTLSPNGSATLVISGTGFSPRSTVYITGSVLVGTYYMRTEDTISVFIRALGSAPLGSRDVIVTNPDGKSVRARAGLRIQ
jgi:hypothetical protein